MSSKLFYSVLALLILGFVTYIGVAQRSKPAEAKVGTYHQSMGEKHIMSGQQHAAYNSNLPSSGPHYADADAPAPWGVYVQEVQDEIFLHNEEHGGIVVAYQPSLPKDQIEKLQKLFAPPYSDPSFSPAKAIVTPRSKNDKPIELAAWTYTLSLDKFDQATIEKFYLQHVSHSPESTGGPYNKPIIQTKGS